MFVNREGQRVPEVSFAERDAAGNWKKVTTADLFAGKSVVLFALPGAFTPTCSSAHVPRYNELYDNFKAAGVDDVLCLSVNDTFVMNAWQHEQGADRITFVPDGNGTFTEGMGLLVGKDQLGFGKRSWRYSMLVRDGVIEKMFIEEDVPGDPFLVSDADTMLVYEIAANGACGGRADVHEARLRALRAGEGAALGGGPALFRAADQPPHPARPAGHAHDAADLHQRSVRGRRRRAGELARQPLKQVGGLRRERRAKLR